MPRFVIGRPVHTPKHEQLIKRLSKELKASGSDPQPLILEQEVPATQSRHVYVIWDQWKGIDYEVRSSIISEAYERAEGTAFAESIAIATGLTPTESVGLGLLRYKLDRARKRLADPDDTAYQKAIAEEARRTILGAKASELRYARLEDAEAALQRLTADLPNSHWIVVEERDIERD